MKKEFFINNRKKIISALPDESMLLIFSGAAPIDSMDIDYPVFNVNRNFFWLTGIDEQNCALLILKRSDATEEILFIPKAGKEEEQWCGKTISEEKATKHSGICAINNFADLENKIAMNIRKNLFRYKTLFLDTYRLAWDSPETPAQIFGKKFRDLYIDISIKSIVPIIVPVRRIKQEDEISEIKKAIELTRLGFNNMLKTARPGIMEYELEAAFLSTLFKKGRTPASFQPIIAGGERGYYLHYPHNNRRVYNKEWVLVDFGAMSKRTGQKPSLYCADITRMIPVSGKFTDFQKKVYNTVLSAHKKSVAIMRPGVTITDWRDQSDKILEEECFSRGLFKLKKSEKFTKYFPHGIGHPLGLDPHDYIDIYGKLEPGMVLTNEPGLYGIPNPETGKTISIRLENDILITENEPINLSENIMIEADEIEEFMANNKK